MKLGEAALLRTVDYKQKIQIESRLKYKTFNTTRGCEKSDTEEGMTRAWGAESGQAAIPQKGIWGIPHVVQ